MSNLMFTQEQIDDLLFLSKQQEKIIKELDKDAALLRREVEQLRKGSSSGDAFNWMAQKQENETLRAVNARLVEQLAKARSTLREMSGILSAHEHVVRQDAGNTNWQCMVDKTSEALRSIDESLLSTKEVLK